jgi:hypothetical protein
MPRSPTGISVSSTGESLPRERDDMAYWKEYVQRLKGKVVRSGDAHARRTLLPGTFQTRSSVRVPSKPCSV